MLLRETYSLLGISPQKPGVQTPSSFSPEGLSPVGPPPTGPSPPRGPGLGVSLSGARPLRPVDPSLYGGLVPGESTETQSMINVGPPPLAGFVRKS